jgi:DNA repair protein RecO (recombination protein O)
MRDHLYRVDALILKRTDIGEADRLLTLYTPDLGKMRAVAKGARKPSSRKTGHVELFNHVSLLLAKAREIDIITQAEAIETFQPLRASLERLGYAYYLAELVDRFCEDGSENRAVFDLTLRAFGWLGDSPDLALTARFFEMQLLQHVGYRPQLFHCVNCGAVIEPIENFFSADAGGVLDPRCNVTFPDAQAISLNALKVLRFLQTRDYAATRALRLSPDLHDEVEALMRVYIAHHLERNLKSVEFLHRLRQRMDNE